jgi:hypothetical protein
MMIMVMIVEWIPKDNGRRGVGPKRRGCNGGYITKTTTGVAAASIGAKDDTWR